MKTVKTTKTSTEKATVKSAVKVAAKPAVKAAAKDVAASPRKKSVTVAPVEVPSAPATPAREITTDLIAARAYVIWEQQGCPQGSEVQNWLLAETQLKQEIRSLSA
jgi:hypothetical protein